MSNQEKAISEIYHCQITQKNYTVNEFEQTVSYNFQQKLNVNTVNLTQFSFYNNFPNITPWYNQFTLKIGSQYYPVIIPESNYSFWNIVDMLTIFNTQINLQITGYGTFTFVQTGNNNKFIQLSNSTNTPFQFVLSPQQNFNQLFQYLGFGAFSKAFKAERAVQVGAFPFNVQTSSNLHIVCKNLTFNSEIQSCLASIPINEPITNLIQFQSKFYQENRHILIKNNSVAIQNITISCIDDLGYQLPIENNRLSLVLIFERYQQ